MEVCKGVSWGEWGVRYGSIYSGGGRGEEMKGEQRHVGGDHV